MHLVAVALHVHFTSHNEIQCVWVCVTAYRFGIKCIQALNMNPQVSVSNELKSMHYSIPYLSLSLALRVCCYVCTFTGGSKLHKHNLFAIYLFSFFSGCELVGKRNKLWFKFFGNYSCAVACAEMEITNERTKLLHICRWLRESHKLD